MCVQFTISYFGNVFNGNRFGFKPEERVDCAAINIECRDRSGRNNGNFLAC
ncbi:MAG: hypothetical protein ABSA97_08780 [Verrucomicrobiia bacterium]